MLLLLACWSIPRCWGLHDLRGGLHNRVVGASSSRGGVYSIHSKDTCLDAPTGRGSRDVELALSSWHISCLALAGSEVLFSLTYTRASKSASFSKWPQ